MSPRTYFGNISSALHRPLDMQVRTSRRTRDDINIRPFIIDDPEPYIPEGFFEQLSEVTKLYEGVMPVRRDAALQASKRRRSNLLTAPGGGIYRQQGDHWLNWRERLAIELDDCEEKG